MTTNKPEPLTMTQIRKIEEGYLEFKTRKQIAEELNIPVGRVSYYLSSNKIKAVGKKREPSKPLPFKRYSKFKIDVPCPIADCADRKDCTEIDDPRQCKVWQLVFVKGKEKDQNKNLKYPISER